MLKHSALLHVFNPRITAQNNHSKLVPTFGQPRSEVHNLVPSRWATRSEVAHSETIPNLVPTYVVGTSLERGSEYRRACLPLSGSSPSSTGEEASPRL